MKHKDFENFVLNEHGKQYCGTKDGCVEDYEEWIYELDSDEWFELGDKYAKRVSDELVECLEVVSKSYREMFEENATKKAYDAELGAGEWEAFMPTEYHLVKQCLQRTKQ